MRLSSAGSRERLASVHLEPDGEPAARSAMKGDWKRVRERPGGRQTRADGRWAGLSRSEEKRGRRGANRAPASVLYGQGTAYPACRSRHEDLDLASQPGPGATEPRTRIPCAVPGLESPMRRDRIRSRCRAGRPRRRARHRARMFSSGASRAGAPASGRWSGATPRMRLAHAAGMRFGLKHTPDGSGGALGLSCNIRVGRGVE
jgi:hypothetical protein